MTIHPVILCGGAGVRLWPASRPDRPKQFLPLVGPHSSFQNTLTRLRGLDGAAAPIVVTGEAHLAAIEAQIAAIGSTATILIEPAGRDSAPAIAAAMEWIVRADPHGLAVVLAADHHIADHAAFRAALAAALDGAWAGRIVTLGVAPRSPSTAYGYIEPGETLGIGALRAVRRFVEKPGAAAARAHAAAGHLWNSGNFVAAASVLRSELQRAAPRVAAAAAAALDGGFARGAAVRLSDAFLAAPKISIDYAVMETTAAAAVLAVDFAWSDLGAWDAVLEASAPDARGNAAEGETILEGTQRCLVRAAPGQVVVAVGVADLAIIAEEDAVLVCHLSASQDVKGAVARLEPAVRAGRARLSVLPAADAPAEDLHDLCGWFDTWVRTAALPLWWTLGADHETGGFFEALDAAGTPLDLPRRSRVQSRQSFVYARAGTLGWKGPWRDAAAHADGYFRRAFLRPDGLHRARVDAAGAPLDERAFLYEEAFALLALAAHGRAREAEALALLDAVEAAFRLEGGGFAESEPPRFLSNPLMHLFEAALAWVETGASPRWRALAGELADFALERLIDARGAFIAEVYDARWRAAVRAEVSPGHQFEWAWLLAQWSGIAGGAGAAMAAAHRLFAAGERGVTAGGVVADAMNDRLAITEAGGRLWPQCERIKAARRLFPGDEGGQARQSALALRRYLAGPVGGLWIDRIDARGRAVAGPAPASSLYHLIGAAEALGAAAAQTAAPAQRRARGAA